MKVGIIGAGFIGKAVAEILLKNGHEVMMCNSRGPETLFSVIVSLPGLKAGNLEDVTSYADLLFLAIPFNKLNTLPSEKFADKVVIDTMNYYPQRDGQITALDNHQTTTSEMLAAHLVDSTVIKAFNAILAKDIVKDADQSPIKRALPVAGDNVNAKQKVMELQESLGYLAVDAGGLSESWRFERAKPAYCVPLNHYHLIGALANAERNIDQPPGSWRQ